MQVAPAAAASLRYQFRYSIGNIVAKLPFIFRVHAPDDRTQRPFNDLVRPVAASLLLAFAVKAPVHIDSAIELQVKQRVDG